MATAYAALVSIMQIIDQLQHHPRPPISLDKQQVQSLTEVVTSLQQFLEAGYNKNASYSDEADPLEMRIADAAHAVEDVIESHIVDRILADREDISSVDFYRAVQRVVDEMELVTKEAMDVMKEKMRSGHELPTADADSSTSAAASSSLDWPEQNTTMIVATLSTLLLKELKRNKKNLGTKIFKFWLLKINTTQRPEESSLEHETENED